MKNSYLVRGLSSDSKVHFLSERQNITKHALKKFYNSREIFASLVRYKKVFSLTKAKPIKMQNFFLFTFPL